MANWNPGQPPGPPAGGGPPPGAPPGGYGAPPAGGYGGAPPPGGPAPYGIAPGGPGYPAPIEGNMLLGFLAGFFGGCIGFALVYFIAKGPKTKRGAAIGFGIAIVVSAIARLAAR